MNEIAHVVFDLGQVLIGWDPEVPFRRLIPDDAERKRFLTEICSPAWNLEQDRGRNWREAEDLLVAAYPEHERLIRAFRANWWEMIPGTIDENIAVVEDLIARGTDVTALTNWAADTYAEAEARFPFLAKFRGVTVSGRIGLVKPNPALYRLHTDTFGLFPERTLFFDDNPANVEGARSFGWQAEHYTSTETLIADLRRYGLSR